jgi:hypothetical protein
MSFHSFDYASPSAFFSTRDRAELGLASDRKRPVRFVARIAENNFLLRIALQALGQLIWSNDQWAPSSWFGASLDPIITVHDDRVFLEAFSGDQSSYGMVIADRSLFDPRGEVTPGTTNVDFTAWLWSALGEMRTSRETFLRIEPGGFEVDTLNAGGRYEKKVDVPDSWVRGFLELQSTMAMPGTHLSCRPVDLIAAIRFLRANKSKVSPRALRYEMTPGQDANIVLEPWEHTVPLKNAKHSYTEKRVIRTWGRRRLRALEPLLPFADRVDVYLKGRALPSFYAVKLPKITFVLGLSGFTDNRFTEGGSFCLLSKAVPKELEKLALDGAVFRGRQKIDARLLATELETDLANATTLLETLVRRGQAIYDVETREFRRRELFAEPIDEAKIHPKSLREEEATAMVRKDEVRTTSRAMKETKKVKMLAGEAREVVHRELVVEGSAGAEKNVEIVVTEAGRIIFGRCECAHFREHLLNKGPCAHMIALLAVTDLSFADLPTSRPT